jgi:VanZ family protein
MDASQIWRCKIKFIKYWLPLCVYMSAVFVVSSMPTLPTPDPKLLKPDKLWHFLEYAILGFLAFRAFQNASGEWVNRHPYLLAILFVAVFGATDEIHQSFVSGRDANPLDWMADATGGALAMGVIRLKNMRTNANRAKGAGT